MKQSRSPLPASLPRDRTLRWLAMTGRPLMFAGSGGAPKVSRGTYTRARRRARKARRIIGEYALVRLGARHLVAPGGEIYYADPHLAGVLVRLT